MSKLKKSRIFDWINRSKEFCLYFMILDIEENVEYIYFVALYDFWSRRLCFCFDITFFLSSHMSVSNYNKSWKVALKTWFAQASISQINQRCWKSHITSYKQYWSNFLCSTIMSYYDLCLSLLFFAMHAVTQQSADAQMSSKSVTSQRYEKYWLM